MSHGDYLGIPSGTTANWAPISWSGSGVNAMLVSTNTPEWTIVFAGTAYQFNLQSLDNATMNTGAFALSGTGVATMTGALNREPTLYRFTLRRWQCLWFHNTN
jgi:hypothetical protein